MLKAAERFMKQNLSSENGPEQRWDPAGQPMQMTDQGLEQC